LSKRFQQELVAPSQKDGAGTPRSQSGQWKVAELSLDKLNLLDVVEAGVSLVKVLLSGRDKAVIWRMSAKTLVRGQKAGGIHDGLQQMDD
jgi:hypothetical protein